MLKRMKTEVLKAKLVIMMNNKPLNESLKRRRVKEEREEIEVVAIGTQLCLHMFLSVQHKRRIWRSIISVRENYINGP